MTNPYVKGWRWNRAQNALVAAVEIVGGGSYEVAFPVERVTTDYVQILGECGLVGCAEEVGFVDILPGAESVDGFLSKVRKAARRARRRVTKVAKRSVVPGAIPFEPKSVRKARQRLMGRKLRGLERRYTRAAQGAVKRARRYGMRAARDKRLGAGLGIAATAFPAVGGPALAAWTVANQYTKHYDNAKQAYNAVRSGVPTPGARQAIARGMRAKRKFQSLAQRQHDPYARLLLQAARSVPG